MTTAATPWAGAPRDGEAPQGDAAREQALWRRLLRRVGTAAGVGAASVPNGAVTVAVVFARREPDALYRVVLTPTWNTTAWPSGLGATGFTVNVGTAPVGAQPVTYQILREG